MSSFDYNLILGHKNKYKWDSGANIIICDNSGTTILEKTKTNNGEEYQNYVLKLVPGKYRLKLPLPNSYYVYDYEWILENRNHSNNNLNGGAYVDFNFTIDSTGFLTKGSDNECQSLSNYILTGELNTDTSANGTIKLKKGGNVQKEIHLTTVKNKISEHLCLDNGDYEIETDDSCNWEFKNEIWNIYQLKADFNASFTINDTANHPITNIQQTGYFEKICKANEISYQVHMIDAGKNNWDSKGETYLTINKASDGTQLFHGTYNSKETGFVEVIRDLCLPKEENFTLSIGIPNTYYGWEISWKISNEDGKINYLSGKIGEEFPFYSDENGILIRGSNKDSCPSTNTYTLELTRLPDTTGEKEVILSGEENPYKLPEDKDSKIFTDICLPFSNYKVTVDPNNPVIWELKNKNHNLYTLKSICDTDFTTVDQNNPFIDTETELPVINCVTDKYWVVMGSVNYNAWDSNNMTKLIIKNKDGAEVFNDAYTTNFNGFSNIIKEVCLPEDDYTISCYPDGKNYYDWSISWGIYKSNDDAKKLINPILEGGSGYSKEISIGNTKNIISETDSICVHQYSYNIKLSDKTNDLEYTLNLKKDGNLVKKIIFPIGKEEYDEDICLSNGNYTIEVNSNEFTYTIQNNKYALDVYTVSGIGSSFLIKDGNDGKGKLDQDVQLYLITTEDTPNTIPVIQTLPPPPPTRPVQTLLSTKRPAPRPLPRPPSKPLLPEKKEEKSHFTTFMIIIGIILVAFIVLIIMKKKKESTSVTSSMPYGYYPSSTVTPSQYTMSTTPN
jgi:hypothetical protein